MLRNTADRLDAGTAPQLDASGVPGLAYAMVVIEDVAAVFEMTGPGHDDGHTNRRPLGARQEGNVTFLDVGKPRTD